MVGDLDKYSPLVVLMRFNVKGEGKKRAKAKEKETGYASLAMFVCR